MVVNNKFWRGKRVFVTGHTGFKGGWLSQWLATLGAEVHGYALEPPTDPSFFATCRLDRQVVSSVVADIRNAERLERAIQDARPEVVFHLAAQSLVRYSYKEPVETYAVNVMGTVNLLEAIRKAPGVKAVVNVTTDKCYDNREWEWPYREDEPLGGHDPYSSSKACSELVTAAYRLSFLEPANVMLASARAGNVIGGGDWAEDRLIPDFFRAVEAGESLTIRSPGAVRPWQHVLEPVAGYLMLAEHLYVHGAPFATAWNFGPEDSDSRPVEWIIERLCQRVAGARWDSGAEAELHEAHTLKLDSSRARQKLGFRPRWNLETALDRTVVWHDAWRNDQDMTEVTARQIAEYTAGGSR
jgi:CDP-glucose 4,6-dehydratase